MGTRRHIGRAALLAAAAGLAACGGGGGGGSAGPTTVEASLTALGVDIAPTPRVADKTTQQPLPGNYAPFGASRTIDKFDELMTVGFRLSPGSFAFDSSVTVLKEQQSPTAPGVFTPEALYAPATASTPWGVSSGATPSTLRAAAAGDVDGDGMDELLVAYFTAGDPSVVLRTIQDHSASFASPTPIPVSGATPTALAIAAGDFDGDGRSDAVVAVSTASDVQLVFLSSVGGALQLSGRTITLTPVSSATALEVSLAAGNLDNDAPDELAVVLNESFQAAGGGDSGVSRYWVYDDATTGFAVRKQAQPVSATAGGAVRAALTASVAIGDVDGDNVGEVVLGGLTNFDPAGTCGYAYLLVALDGLDASLASLGATYQSGLFPAGSTCAGLRMRTVHLVTLDRDGDGADEIQANQLAFQDFREAAPWTPLGPSAPGTTDVGLHQLFGGTGSTYSGELSRATSAFAAGDLTSDKKQDLIFYSQPAAATVRVLAMSDDGTGQVIWRETLTIPTDAAPAAPLWPLLVPANVDEDSMAIQYAPAERRVVFTQPIVIAALAAAPCASNLGQNPDACRTSFGTAHSSTVATELTYTVTAGITVGASTEASIPGLKFDLEVARAIKATWAAKLNASYTLTKRVVRTTGPLEDGVIFTSIPYDQFIYKIVSHPDPTLIGTDVVVSIPREPIETLVERGYYNAHVPAGALQVDGTVFHHVPGQPHTYPTAAEKNTLIQAHPQLFIGPFDVGQGGGSTSAEIDVATELGAGVSYGVEQSLEVKATAANVLAGFTIGFSADASLQISHGSESYYAGAVSNIAADKYTPSTAYKFGLMTYIHDDPRQSFEVVNYWVE